VYEVNAHSLHTPIGQHSWHCNIQGVPGGM